MTTTRTRWPPDPPKPGPLGQPWLAQEHTGACPGRGAAAPADHHRQVDDGHRSSLVRANLHADGDVTVGDALAPEALHDGRRVRFVTDLDTHFAPERADLIVGEVKEGPALLNPALQGKAVLAALARIGRPAGESRSLTWQLFPTGTASPPSGHRIRMAACSEPYTQSRDRHLSEVAGRC